MAELQAQVAQARARQAADQGTVTALRKQYHEAQGQVKALQAKVCATSLTTKEFDQKNT